MRIWIILNFSYLYVDRQSFEGMDYFRMIQDGDIIALHRPNLTHTNRHQSSTLVYHRQNSALTHRLQTLILILHLQNLILTLHPQRSHCWKHLKSRWVYNSQICSRTNLLSHLPQNQMSHNNHIWHTNHCHRIKQSLIFRQYHLKQISSRTCWTLEKTCRLIMMMTCMSQQVRKHFYTGIIEYTVCCHYCQRDQWDDLNQSSQSNVSFRLSTAKETGQSFKFPSEILYQKQWFRNASRSIRGRNLNCMNFDGELLLQLLSLYFLHRKFSRSSLKSWKN